MRNFLAFFFIFLLGNLVFAQDYDSAYVEFDSIEDQVYDETVVEVVNPFDGMKPSDSLLKAKPQTENPVYSKKFKENLASRYKGDEFSYETNKPRESFWNRFLAKLQRFFDSIFGEPDLNSSYNIGKILLRLFAIILIGFVIYFLVKYLIGNNIGFFGKKNSKTEIKDEDLHENIHEINFADTIAKFENSAEYRLAVRYQFLLILKKLSDKKLITWNPEKTNRDYNGEIKDENLKKRFADLALIFDYIWYGEFGVDYDHYLKYKEQFQAFKP